MAPDRTELEVADGMELDQDHAVYDAMLPAPAARKRRHERGRTGLSSPPVLAGQIRTEPGLAPQVSLASLRGVATTVPEAFSIDIRPDPKNIEYQSLYKGDIPAYRRHGGNFCLGLPTATRLLFNDGRSGRQTDDSSQRRMLRYCHAEVAARESDPSVRRLRLLPRPALPAAAGSAVAQATQQYIPLSRTAAEKELGVENGENLDEYIKRRTREFNESLRLNPRTADRWLEFVAFQVTCVTSQNRPNEPLSSGKLSIFSVYVQILPSPSSSYFFSFSSGADKFP